MEISNETRGNIQDFINSLTKANGSEINNYISEILSDNKFNNSIARKGYFGTDEKPFSFQMAVDISSRLALYVLCRIMKPTVVVETGVASGMSSSYILRALDKNAHGKLFSIDIPWYTVAHNWKKYFAGKDIKTYPIETQSGWIIPDYLKDRWELTLGMTSEKLPPLLSKVGTVDIFFHDSEHSYENMSWEFRTIWPSLRKNGVMLAHNIDSNEAFNQFEQSVGGNSFKLSHMNNDGRLMTTGGKVKG